MFVVPLYRHKDVKDYIKEESPVSMLARDDSFVKKYVKRDEIVVETARSKVEELNSNKESVDRTMDDQDEKKQGGVTDSMIKDMATENSGKEVS